MAEDHSLQLEADVRSLRRGVVRVLAVLLGVCAASCGSSPTSPSTSASLPPMSLMLSEKVLGNASAPVTMVEYSSLTCPHCGDYHVGTLPTLKALYVDTGRVRIVYRDFPLNESAIVASMVARCAGDNFFTVLDALYRAQSSWASASDYKAALKTVVAPLGMTSALVDACVASSELRNGLLSIKSAGSQAHGVNATPTFVINNLTFVGALSLSEFAAVISSFQ
jgi:protein-disulfide isomerase